MAKEENSDGSSVSYEYDASGNVTKETNVTVENDKTKTTVTSYTYDEMGNLLTTQSEGDSATYVYDKAGRTLRVTQNGETTRTLYDDEGRTVQEIAPEDYDSSKDGLPTSNTYADANAGHRYVYNQATGNLDREINRLDVTTTYKYNDVGAKIQEKFDIYEFNYIPHGELESVKISGKTKVSYSYDDNNKLLSENYANGDSVRYEYDDNGNLARQYHNDDTSPYVAYSYNTDNELTQKTNSDTGLKYVYGENNSVEVYRLSDNTLLQSYTESKTEADEENGIESKTDVTESHFGDTYSYTTKNNSISYQYGNNSLAYSTKSNDKSQTVSDSVKLNGTTAVESKYSYDENGNVLTKSYGKNTSIANTYDSKDRITSTTYAGKTTNYTYDSNDQLLSANDDTYAYDSRGNITSKTEFGTTSTFNYSNSSWKDELTAVNGTPLTYDENGNVLTYGDKSFTWNTGRNLESITDGDNKYSYTYDENGIRTSKTVNGVTTYYNTKDGVILSQIDGTNTMYFQYDTNGFPLGFIYNGIQYFYLTNQMGDVIGITDISGTVVGNYEYDAWGKVLTADTDIAKLNPIRYRGYYYDNETDYYYLQSRYYDSNICRFINADSIDYIRSDINNGQNIFVYCLNDPIMNSDYAGCSIAISAAAIIAAAITAVVAIVLGSIALTNCVNSIPNSVYGRVVCGVENKVRCIISMFTLVKNGLKSVINDINSRIKKNKKSNSTQIHHIVPKNVKLTIVRATKYNKGYSEYVKKYYIKAGLDIESEHNKIKLKTRVHRALNTNNYYSAVFYLTSEAYDITSKSKPRKTIVLISVLFIKSILKIINENSPSWGVAYE